MTGCSTLVASFGTASGVRNFGGCITRITLNPFDTPKSGGLKLPRLCSVIWLIAWLGVSAVFFVLAGRQFMAGRAVRQRIIESGRSLDSVAPTMLSEHPAAGVALICMGLICVLFAFRWTRTGVWRGRPPAN